MSVGAAYTAVLSRLDENDESGVSSLIDDLPYSERKELLKTRKPNTSNEDDDREPLLNTIAEYVCSQSVENKTTERSLLANVLLKIRFVERTEILLVGDKNGVTPLHIACRLDNHALVKEILELTPMNQHLTLLQTQETVLKFSAFHKVARFGSEVTMECIIGNLPKLKNFISLMLIKDKISRTPLHASVGNGESHNVALLLLQHLRCAYDEGFRSGRY